MRIVNNNGYEICFDEFVPENTTKIVVAVHGFSGDRTSTCIRMLADKLNENSIGVVTFDWPAHGESPVDGSFLTIDNCLSDLDFICGFVKNKYPNVPISLFATSFGGYLGLLYNHLYSTEFENIILRAPAINMYNILTSTIMDENIHKSLEETGRFKFGYEREIFIEQKFLDDLEKNDVFKMYDGKKNLNYYIIHGTVDDVVPIDDSIEFCEKFGSMLYRVEGADHRFKKEGELDRVIDIAFNILK